MRYAVVAVQGSAVAQSNLAWILERSSAYDRQQRSEMCLRLLSQAAQGGLPDAWVDAGNIQYGNQQPGVRAERPSMKRSFFRLFCEENFAVCNFGYWSSITIELLQWLPCSGEVEHSWLFRLIILHTLSSA